jgi:hypothetical protein
MIEYNKETVTHRDRCKKVIVRELEMCKSYKIIHIRGSFHCNYLEEYSLLKQLCNNKVISILK